MPSFLLLFLLWNKKCLVSIQWNQQELMLFGKQASSCMFHLFKKVIHVWNEISVNKWSKNDNLNELSIKRTYVSEHMLYMFFKEIVYSQPLLSNLIMRGLNWRAFSVKCSPSVAQSRALWSVLCIKVSHRSVSGECLCDKQCFAGCVLLCVWHRCVSNKQSWDEVFEKDLK